MAVKEQTMDVSKEEQPAPTIHPMEQSLGNITSGLASALVSNIVPIKSRNGISLASNGYSSMAAKFKEMVLKQQEFASDDKPCYADIGYHWNVTSKIDPIRVRGLLSRAELESRGLASAINKGCVSYGDGIYTADDPTSYRPSATMTCLMVARLKGRQGFGHGRSLASNAQREVIRKFDTIVGFSSWEKVVKSSEQCVPLVCFDNAALREDALKIFKVHAELQIVLDLLLNGGDEIPVDNWTMGANAPLYVSPFRACLPSRAS